MRWLPLLLLVFSACDHHHDHPDQGHDDEERSLQVTVWGDRFEVFLEHPVLVSGTPAEFITHVSDLETLRPRVEGPATFVLTPGQGEPVRHTEDAPKRDGIYLPALTFPTSGEWSFSLEIPLDGDTHVVKLPSLQVYGTQADADAAEIPDGPEGISFLKEQQWRLLTRVDRVSTRTLVDRLRLTGVIESTPGGRASASSPFAGAFLPVPGGSLPQVGRVVTRGEPLAVVRPSYSDLVQDRVQAESRVREAELELQQTTLTLERIEKLAKGGARSARDLQDARYAHDKAEAQLNAAKAARHAGLKAGTALSEDDGLPVFEVTAPIAGTLVEVGAAAGEYVTADRPLFRIVDISRVTVRANLPEADLARLGESPDALLELSTSRGTFLPIDSNVDGRLLLIGPEVDPHSRTVPLIYELQNRKGDLRPGMAVTVHIHSRAINDAVAIPDGAIVNEDGQPVAFVMLAGETFEKRHLRLGVRDGEWVQVLEGLAPGDRVVTKEAYAVRLASVSTSSASHGHAH